MRAPLPSPRRIAVGAGLALLAAGLTPIAASANPAGNGLVINEVYGGGGNSGATLKNDFIELYNPTDAAIAVAGLVVAVAGSQNGTGAATGVTCPTRLGTGEGHYLVQAVGRQRRYDEPADARRHGHRSPWPAATGTVLLQRHDRRRPGRGNLAVANGGDRRPRRLRHQRRASRAPAHRRRPTSTRSRPSATPPGPTVTTTTPTSRPPRPRHPGELEGEAPVPSGAGRRPATIAEIQGTGAFSPSTARRSTTEGVDHRDVPRHLQRLLHPDGWHGRGDRRHPWCLGRNLRLRRLGLHQRAGPRRSTTRSGSPVRSRSSATPPRSPRRPGRRHAPGHPARRRRPRWRRRTRRRWPGARPTRASCSPRPTPSRSPTSSAPTATPRSAWPRATARSSSRPRSRAPAPRSTTPSVADNAARAVTLDDGASIDFLPFGGGDNQDIPLPWLSRNQRDPRRRRGHPRRPGDPGLPQQRVEVPAHRAGDRRWRSGGDVRGHPHAGAAAARRGRRHPDRHLQRPELLPGDRARLREAWPRHLHLLPGPRRGPGRRELVHQQRSPWRSRARRPRAPAGQDRRGHQHDGRRCREPRGDRELHQGRRDRPGLGRTPADRRAQRGRGHSAVGLRALAAGLRAPARRLAGRHPHRLHLRPEGREHGRCLEGPRRFDRLHQRSPAARPGLQACRYRG